MLGLVKLKGRGMYQKLFQELLTANSNKQALVDLICANVKTQLFYFKELVLQYLTKIYSFSSFMTGIHVET